MPRSLRIEKENGVYHIINRGNYRQDVFINEGAHVSFEQCLFETCEKCGWILEGFCVMTNHFHLVVRTPKGNLIYGMKWLQSTFANRYHKFRKVHGKLFQGRYKSLIVEEDGYLGALLHYTHLNPVRAGMTDVAGLRHYRWSSYWYLNHPAKRPAFMDCSGALLAAGGLADTSYGRRKYADYLNWLASNKTAQDEMAFDKMCRGWALGTKDFKKALIAEATDTSESDDEDDEPTKKVPRYDGATLQEANELRWELVLEQCMQTLNKTDDDATKEMKSADWKILIAAVLKCKTSASNVWIADQLNMGVPHAVSRYVGVFKQNGNHNEATFLQLIANITT
ncbi:transposase [Coraliomargarita algicola]|uniref:Transposase n=2 Tax=Coraliomargaritaceae TaxID=3056371 RepID=A0ABZ0RR24_9BACT|nr:transposase [Coraliomargarita sp. J2-16]WPJ97553.1 transposase [Coraliomargarita sp. J2-16]